MTHLETVKHIAKKSHRCDCCYRNISSGEAYTRTAHIFEGDFCVWKECPHCTAFIDHIGWEYIENTSGVYDEDSVYYGASDYVSGSEKATEYDRVQLTNFRNGWRSTETQELQPVPYQVTSE